MPQPASRRSSSRDNRIKDEATNPAAEQGSRTLIAIGIAIEALKADPKAMRQRAPAHPLDLPDVIIVDDYEDGPAMDRATALDWAAKHNRKAMARGDKWTMEWLVAVELGDLLPDQCVSGRFCGDIGVEDVASHRPVRLVRPTETEIALYGQLSAATI